MYSRFSDGIDNEWNRQLLPLWLCFLWITVAPFASLYRVGPLSSFYLEAASLMGACALVLTTTCQGLLNVKLPKISIGLLILAAFWWLQTRLMQLTYPGMSDMVVATFVILALAAWACRGWVAEYGQERIVTVFAWSLLFGALIQAVVAFMQFKGWAGVAFLKGIIAYGGTNNVSGQLGQRNHLGHYLMWGLMAAAYLWGTRKMPNWLGALLIIGLPAVLGLVNSRTILGYVIAIALLLPFWRWRASKGANRLLLITTAAIALVAVFQYAMGPLLDLISDAAYETAVERAGNSGFEGSMRQIEWRKAWLAFQTAPWFGHGWNGFALQSFLIHAQQKIFSNNILGVLFTHSHNMVMQLLAEVGIIGTLLVFACMAAGIWRLLVHPYHPASFLLLALMAVSMCHSMLEYPLWYIYFLTPFTLMFALAPARYEDVSDGRSQRLRHIIGGIAALLFIGGLFHTGWVYTELTRYARQPKNDSPEQVQRKIQGLRDIAASSSLLRYHAELSLTRRADPTDETVKPWAEQAAMRALRYRPYANAYQLGLYQYRRGETHQGEQWMQAMYYYYPYMMYFYTAKIRSRPEFRPLLKPILTVCKDFRAAPKHQTAKPCTAE